MFSFRFYDLDLTLTLKENLENKTIVEFPTLYVIMKDHSDIYEIVDTGKYHIRTITLFIFYLHQQIFMWNKIL